MDETQSYPHLGRWLASCALAIFIGAVTIFYGLFHLGLNVSVKVLWAPFLVISVLTLFLAPGLYWSWKERIIHKDKSKSLYLVSGAYTLLSFLIYVHYALSFGLLSRSSARAAYVAILMGVPAVFVGGFYLRKTLFER